MSISKTRQKLVDVARQLFAKNGVANTTMNDIAKASGKGRRTLYTYFKSKDDVYYAVIESELERLSDKLDEVAAKKMKPQDKIVELIYTHLSMIKETVVRNGNLRADFFVTSGWLRRYARALTKTSWRYSVRYTQTARKTASLTLRMLTLWLTSPIIASRGLKYPLSTGAWGTALRKKQAGRWSPKWCMAHWVRVI